MWSFTPEGLEQVVAATEKALEAVGAHCKRLLLIRLKREFNSGLEIAFTDPEHFHKALSELLGRSSSSLLERMIMESLGEESHTKKEFAEFIRSLRTP